MALKLFGMIVEGLGQEWEANDEIRERLRSQHKLCLHPATQRYCEPNRPNAVNNSMVILPCMHRLRESPGWKLPHLEPLQVEVGYLFNKMGKPTDDKEIYKVANEIKKLTGFVKRKLARREVTKASNPSH